MCQICATFNPQLSDCEYEGLTSGQAGGGTGTPGPQGAVINESGDASGGTGTSASMAVSDYFFGSLSTGTDTDWVGVSLVAGQTYTFAVVGTGALDDAANDTYLRLRDASGTQIDENDDGGPGRNSTITFTAGSTGTYYLDVGSYVGTGLPLGDEGTYGLSMTLGNRASYDVTMGAGNLLRPDASWAASSGTGATVTWAIRASGTEPSGGNPFIAPSADQTAAIEAALDHIAGISGLTFSQVNPGGTSNDATMLFGAYNSTTDGAGAYAYYPGSTASGATAGDVWLNNNSVSTTSLPIGSYSYFVMLHEIGHALGLAHPGDYNAAPGVSITYANDAQFTEDSRQYTVMSYFSQTNTGASSGLGYPDTLMLFDLLALHQQYGADTSYHAGATTYGFNATVGGAYDFSTNTTPFLSIWDGSGTDTIDLSGYAMAQNLSLIEGVFSDIGGFTGNMSIAIGAVIENAIGGSGNDTLVGNAAANNLDGGLGDDTLFGSAGADTMNGGGGTGDWVSYANATSGLGARLDGVAGWGFAAGDVISNVENLSGSGFNDVLVGNGSANQLVGDEGNDTLYAGSGNDTLNGDGGMDVLHGQLGDDVLNGGNDNDTLFGGGGADTLNGDGGTGDFASYDGSGSGVGIRLDGGANWGGALGDVYSGIEGLIGSGNNDTIIGSGGNDLLFGGGGNDTIYAGGGGDILNGNGGDDSLFGQAGDDTLYGSLGNDRMDGGADTDTAVYTDATSSVGLRLDGLANFGWATGDTFFNLENLTGGVHNDVLVGHGGANQLVGGLGDDTIYALGGTDTLIGGAGDDSLFGQGGSDVFVFSDGFGDDTINGFDSFDDSEDIDLSLLSSITSFAQLQTGGRMTQVGGNVVIDDLGGNTITLTGVNLFNLDANDFIF